MKKLVLAEKPSVGRDIARVLGCTKGSHGYLEGNAYIVTWAMGHLIELATPEMYDKAYEKWREEDLPILPGGLRKVVIRKTSKQFNTVKKLLQRNDVGEVIIATDAGREGELVARWILHQAKVKKPLKRLWISSVTDKAITQGFASLKEGRQYENLFAAAEARAEADWIVGINATRALTVKHNAQLSCGRVQTPTLAMIAKRDQDIREFQPKTYFGLTLVAGSMEWLVRDKKNQTRFYQENKVDQVRQQLTSAVLTVGDKTIKEKKSQPPHLYDLTSLQQDANKRYGFSPKRTLSLMQKLYEQHKVLTYPRTDSKHLTDDIVETLGERLASCGVGEYAKYAARIRKRGIQASKHFVDNNKVSDHHAIIPTEDRVYLQTLTDDERKIYDLVVRRFLAVLYPAYVMEETKLTATFNDLQVTANGTRTKQLGWKEVMEGSEENPGKAASSTMEDIVVGEQIPVEKVRKTTGKTAPPAQFTEASLLAAMENPKRFMEGGDTELEKILDSTGGIGTVATRADVIEKLFNGFYIEKTDKGLKTTSKGRQLLDLAPEALRSPLLTAQWEKRLQDIAAGKEKKTAFVGDMRSYTKKAVGDILSSAKTYKHDNVSRSKCPECGKFLLDVKGKRGKMQVCPDRECGYKKRLSTVTNARCPECHKKMELKGQGDKKLFTCKCGYRERLTAFENRKKKASNKASKKDVNQYLKHQKSDEPFNNAFAAAFEKLKKD